jgi:hypothetical protein
MTPQLNWRLPTSTTKLLHGGSFEVTSFARRQIPQRMGGGNTNYLGRIVDLGILSQSTKFWGIWLAREREIYEA